MDEQWWMERVQKLTVALDNAWLPDEAYRAYLELKQQLAKPKPPILTKADYDETERAWVLTYDDGTVKRLNTGLLAGR